MSLPNLDAIESNLKNVLQQLQIYDVTLDEFAKCKRGQDMVRFCWKLMSCHGILQDLELCDYKSVDLSEMYRIQGNREFAKGNDLLAIMKYTKAASFAPYDEKEFALAVGNRSAVTSSLEEHEHCVADINFALKYFYPDNLKFKLLTRKGKSLIQLGQLEKASLALEEALSLTSLSGLTGDKLEKDELKIKELLNQCTSQKEFTPVHEEKSYHRIPKMSYEPSEACKNYQSSAIRIVHSEEMGRHLIATRDISPGEVLVVERPYVKCLVTKSYGLYCYRCMKRSYSLIPCPSCIVASYCSEQCMRLSYMEDHLIECPATGAFLDIGCNKMELLGLKVLMKASAGGLGKVASLARKAEATQTTPLMYGHEDGVYVPDSYNAIHFLEGNQHLRQPSEMFRRSVFVATLLYILHSSSPTFSSLDEDFWYAGELLLSYYQSVSCNSHQISEMVMRGDGLDCVEVGGGLYGLLSLTNHSCDPNVVRQSLDGDLALTKLIAIQCISEGEQIFDNYGYHYAVHTLQHRQSHLKSQYYFTCGCIACQEDWPLYENMPSENPIYLPGADLVLLEKFNVEFTKILEELKSAKSKGLPESFQYEEALDLLCRLLEILQRSIKRPWKQYANCQEAIKQMLSLHGNITYETKHA